MTVRTIGITGASGLLGWHLACAAKASGASGARLAGRSEFADTDTLDRFIAGCDAVVHFAGMNRGAPAAIEETNVALAGAVLDAMDRTGTRPVLVFADSTQRDLDTPYGRSKRQAAQAFQGWAERNAAAFIDLVLPNVFGELGRPFTNSAVSTFCHQLAHAQEPRIIEDREIELVHAQDVAATVLSCIEDARPGEFRLTGQPIRVSEVLRRLRDLCAEYQAAVIPELPTAFDRQLFNTLRSYLFAVRPSQPPHPSRGSTRNVRRTGKAQRRWTGVVFVNASGRYQR